MSQKWIPPLPAGWEARFDYAQRRYFFINHSNQRTQWEDPRFPAKPTASHAAASLSPTRGASQSSSSHGIQMQEMSPGRARNQSQHNQESNLSEDVDNAIVTKLCKEFPKASKELVSDMLVSCHNDERSCREQLKDFGFTENRSSSARQAPSQPQQRQEPKELSQLEINRRYQLMKAKFPDVDMDVIKMSLQVVKFDMDKGTRLIQNYILSNQSKKTENRPATSSTEDSRSSSASSVKSVDLEPAALDDSASNRPQAFSSGGSSVRASSATSVPSGSGTQARSNHGTPTRQPQQYNKAKTVTKAQNRRGPSPRKVVTTQPPGAQTLATSALSSQRTPALGPDPNLQRGPDRSLLCSEKTLANGPDLSLRNGTDRSLRCGPDRSRVCGPMGAVGPDRSIRCGPQASFCGPPSGHMLVSEI